MIKNIPGLLEDFEKVDLRLDGVMEELKKTFPSLTAPTATRILYELRTAIIERIVFSDFMEECAEKQSSLFIMEAPEDIDLPADLRRLVIPSYEEFYNFDDRARALYVNQKIMVNKWRLQYYKEVYKKQEYDQKVEYEMAAQDKLFERIKDLHNRFDRGDKTVVKELLKLYKIRSKGNWVEWYEKRGEVVG